VCDQIVKHLNEGTSPASLWDAIFLRAGELLMQHPGIVGIHCVTSVNALHFGYQHSGIDETRRMLLLQAAAFLALFHKRLGGDDRPDLHIDTLEKGPLTVGGADAVKEILADVSKDRLTAARKTLALIEGGADPTPLMTSARRLIFSKGTDSHDYKFSSAALEDCYHMTHLEGKARYLATSMFNLHGSGDRDNDLLERARAALGKV
jgi:hypothetical protein